MAKRRRKQEKIPVLILYLRAPLERGEERRGEERRGEERRGEEERGGGEGRGEDGTGRDGAARHGTAQDRAGQGRTGQDRTGQDRTGQDRTGQDRTGQDRTGQDRTVGHKRIASSSSALGASTCTLDDADQAALPHEPRMRGQALAALCRMDGHNETVLQTQSRHVSALTRSRDPKGNRVTFRSVRPFRGHRMMTSKLTAAGRFNSMRDRARTSRTPRRT